MEFFQRVGHDQVGIDAFGKFKRALGEVLAFQPETLHRDCAEALDHFQRGIHDAIGCILFFLLIAKAYQVHGGFERARQHGGQLDAVQRQVVCQWQHDLLK